MLDDNTWQKWAKRAGYYICGPCANNGRNLNRNKLSDAEYLYKKAKERSKKLNREFSISLEDVQAVDTDRCPILDIPIKRYPITTNGKGKKMPDCKSLDRIDSTKGYIPGNIRIISWKANSMFSDCPPTVAETQALLNYLTTTNTNGSQI